MQRLRQFLRALFQAALRKLTPPTITKEELARENEWLKNRMDAESIADRELLRQRQVDYLERVGELIEARQMAGSGPWKVNPKVLEETDKLIDLAAAKFEANASGTKLRETVPAGAVGATSDIELALQNVEWRREVNLSWMEFSRWGIQQIILISRLHYVKHPWIQRCINIVAAYVFGRGVEVMSEDDDANDVLKDFFNRNKKVLGQAALAKLQRQLLYDGQVFFCFFSDRIKTGEVNVRTIDATEISEIITNPDDTDSHWFYKREWSIKVFNAASGSYSGMEVRKAYYPALDFIPSDEQHGQAQIDGVDVMWDTPVLMFKGGVGLSKWSFDTPTAYAALDWAKAGRKWLEACSTVNLALAQFATKITTKGGQQALAGIKQQLSTTVGPSTPVWDQNPTAVVGSVFASGPGTTIEAFKTQGAGGDPKSVAEYRSMAALPFGVPATFLGDLETANLATATTLDRPTELSMLERQECWRECLITIATYVLNVDQGAAAGRLQEAKKNTLAVVEAKRRQLKNGRWVYEAKSTTKQKDLELKCIFPAIREGDLPMLIKAISEAMTLDNKGGQIVGIDEKVGVGLLYEQLGVEDSGDILEEQYPDKEYDPDRTKEVLPPPVMKAQPSPGGAPQLSADGTTRPATQPADSQPPQNGPNGSGSTASAEAARKLILAVEKGRSNGKHS